MKSSTITNTCTAEKRVPDPRQDRKGIDADDLIVQLDAAGIRRAVVLSVPPVAITARRVKEGDQVFVLLNVAPGKEFLSLGKEAKSRSRFISWTDLRTK